LCIILSAVSSLVGFEPFSIRPEQHINKAQTASGKAIDRQRVAKTRNNLLNVFSTYIIIRKYSAYFKSKCPDGETDKSTKLPTLFYCYFAEKLLLFYYSCAFYEIAGKCYFEKLSDEKSFIMTTV